MNEVLTPALAAEWDELAEQTTAPPFLRPGWFELWHRAFGNGCHEVPAVRTGAGELSAVTSLCRGRGVARAAANWHSPLFGAVARDGEAARELALSLLPVRARRLDLSLLPDDDPFATELEAIASERGERVLKRVVQRSPYLELDGSFADLETRLASKRRSDLRRRRRRLDEAGTVSVDVSDGSSGLDPALAKGFRIEGSGWKNETGTAIASRSETKNFYTGVARWAAERDWLRLWFLRLDGRPIAFELTLVHGGALYVLKGGYDHEYSRYSPSLLLSREMIAWSFALGLKRFEYLGQDEPYKRVFADATRELIRLQVFGSTLSGSVSSLAWRRGRPIAKRALALADSLRAKPNASR